VRKEILVCPGMLEAGGILHRTFWQMGDGTLFFIVGIVEEPEPFQRDIPQNLYIGGPVRVTLIDWAAGRAAFPGLAPGWVQFPWLANGMLPPAAAAAVV